MQPNRVDAAVDLLYGGLIFVAVLLMLRAGTVTGVAFGVGVLLSYVLHVAWKMARFDPEWMTSEVAEEVETTVTESVEETVAEEVEETVAAEVETTVTESVEETVAEEVDEVLERVEEVDERVERRPKKQELEEAIEKATDDRS
ncbi:MAG: hypothetical protein ACLFR6_01570 [Salinarchaeum sp.]